MTTYTPCQCDALDGKPHKPGQTFPGEGGDDCNGELDCDDRPVCRNCGCNDIGWHRGYKGARDTLGGVRNAGPPLEPDESAGYFCEACGDEDIAESRAQWNVEWEGEEPDEPPHDPKDDDWDLAEVEWKKSRDQGK